MLEQFIRTERAQKDILLMTHLVLGYPSFEQNRALIAQMVTAGVELIELQIPFSEPTSDGPVILKANDDALKHGTTVAQCLELAQDVCRRYPQVAFQFMTYYNILYAYGVEQFVAKAKELGIRGLIVPDAPPEEAPEYVQACTAQEIAPIFIFTPTNRVERLQKLANVCRGFVYCVGRRGVTGMKTEFSEDLKQRIKVYRRVTTLPLALGFGIREKMDIDFLKGKVDIAVLGTHILHMHETQGAEVVGAFLKSLRA